MTETFECKLKGRLGTGEHDEKEMRVLNRIVRLVPEGIEMEADTRHAKALIEAMGVETGKSVGTPIVPVAPAAALAAAPAATPAVPADSTSTNESKQASKQASNTYI